MLPGTVKIIQLNHADISGGAARAAYRIHHALRQAGVDSRMWVDAVATDDWTVRGLTSIWSRRWLRLRLSINSYLLKSVFKADDTAFLSPAILPSGRVDALNTADADLLHLHWLQNEMLSIADIGRLRKPQVWTLHDMWAFCGAEHYTEAFRWREGYRENNRPSYESGFDLNRWTWQRKRKHWQRPMHMVTPSYWLAQCVRESALMRDWPVSVIPNAIDTECWRPIEQVLARELLSLPRDVPLLLFGAIDGGQDPRKGFDLLQAALQHLRGEVPELQLLVFGQSRPKDAPELGLPIHYTGHLHDELSLRALYSAADVFVLPSRQDNLPNTCVESLACGTPVVAFDTCGVPDIVSHQQTGYLAKAFETEDLARGISWVLHGAKRAELRESARQTAVEKFSNPVIAKQYKSLYQKILGDSRAN